MNFRWLPMRMGSHLMNLEAKIGEINARNEHDANELINPTQGLHSFFTPCLAVDLLKRCFLHCVVCTNEWHSRVTSSYVPLKWALELVFTWQLTLIVCFINSTAASRKDDFAQHRPRANTACDPKSTRRSTVSGHLTFNGKSQNLLVTSRSTWFPLT